MTRLLYFKINLINIKKFILLRFNKEFEIIFYKI